MSISLRTKYLSIKKEKLSETAKGLLKSMYEATDGFKDAKATKKLKPKFDAFYDKLVKSKPEAIKGASKPKESSAASSFKEARERRQSQAGVPKGEPDIKKDAGRPAIDTKGKRVTDGKHYPYKKGNVYYEYRDNRYDKRPAKYPKLEDGGHVQGYDDREDERLSMEHGKMAHKDFVGSHERMEHSRRDDARFEERMADGGMMAKGGKAKYGKLMIDGKEETIFEPIKGYKIYESKEMGGEPFVIEILKYPNYGGKGVRYYYSDSRRSEREYSNNLNNIMELMEKDLKNYKGNKITEIKYFADGGMMAKGGEMHRIKGGDMFAEGGETDNGNVEMVMSNTKAIEHHAKELKELVNMNTPIEAWVVAKLERAETDLSDVTHYIDGLKKYADGGELDGHDVEIYFNMKDKVADPYTVIIDGSVYSMSGTTGAYSVNMYVGEMEEFEPQAVRGWGKKIDFVNADPELIKQIESRFDEDLHMDDSMMDVLDSEDFYLYDRSGKKYELYKKEGDMFMFSSFKVPFGKALVINRAELENKIKNGEYSVKEDRYSGYMADGGMMAKGGNTNNFKINYKLRPKTLNLHLGKYGYNDYANRRVKNWNVDDFKSYVFDYTTYEDFELTDSSKKNPLLKEIFVSGNLPVENGELLPIGANNNEYFNKYKSSSAVLYDIWNEIVKENKLNPSNDNELLKEPKPILTLKEQKELDDYEKLYKSTDFDVWISKDSPNTDELRQRNQELQGKVNLILEHEGKPSKYVKGGMMAKGEEIMGVDEKAKIERAKNKPSKWIFSITYADMIDGKKEWRSYPNYVSEYFNSQREAEEGLEKKHSKKNKGGMMANGGTIAEKTSVEVGDEKISVIKNRKEKTGYPLYIVSVGYAPITLDVYATKELANKKAKELAKKEGYKFADGGKMAKGGTLKTKAKYIPKYQIEEVEVDINGKEKEIDGADLLDGIYVKKASYEKKAPVKKAKGGEVKPKSKKTGNKSIGEIAALAKSIRKEGEQWTSAIKRASAQLKAKK